MFMTAAAIAAFTFSAQAGPVVVTADRDGREVTEARGTVVPMLNRAAILASQGDHSAARKIYAALEQVPSEYKLETMDGRWMYPAEIARRGLLAMDRSQTAVNLAVR